MNYQYYRGSPVTFNYDFLDTAKLWPNPSPNGTDPLVVVKGWYWPLEQGKKVSLKEVRDEITAEIDFNEALDIILNKCSVEYIGEAVGVAFTGNGTSLGPMKKMFPHVHAPVKECDYKKCPNLTVVIPIKITEPITDEICFSKQTNVPWDTVDLPNVTDDDWLRVANQLTITENVERIKLPNEGEYLVVEFEGSTDLHWVDNISNNHYLYLILEGHVK